MFEDRSLKLDLCALALSALVVFLGIALWTYAPADPPSTLVWPPSETVQNACGRAGALAAHHLLECLGIGAYYLAGSLTVLTFFLFVRREVDQRALRTVGWLISVVGLTTLAALAAPNWTPGPVVGAGGYVGAMGRAFLETHFAYAGALIFALSVLMAGLLLSTDYFMFRAAAVTTSVTGRTLLQVGHLGHASGKSKRSRATTDLEDEEELDEDDDPEAAYEDEEEDDYEAEEDELDEDEAEDEIKVRTPGDGSAEGERAGRSPPPAGDEAGTPRGGVAAPNPAPGSRFANGLKAALGITNRRQQAQAQIPKLPPKTEREEVIEQLDAADQKPLDSESQYELPPVDLLLPNDEVCYEEHEKEVRRKAKILEKTFKDFGFNVRVAEIETGPVIAQYEVELEAGLRLSKITGLADDLAIALRVPSVRIVAPIPGKNTVGIEVPNENRQLVRLREVIEETNGRAKRMKIPVYLGKDVAGNPMVVDLAALPHLLIAGRTGTGKSVCLNSIIVSMLMTRGPDEVRMLMIDPKMVELNGYRKLPHLMHPVVTDMRKAEAILAWAVDKMEERYQLLSRAGVRHVSVYNQLGDDELRQRIRPESDDEWRQVPRQLPYIVIVADELADLMLTAGKDVEQHIIRLAQKSRAVGIHLILATQKPTVDVITGLIKSNLPARIAFQVASRTDSRVVLDEMGAEKLLGNGDMLFLLPGTSTMLRGQGTYLSDDEITRVVDFVGTDDPQFAGELLQLKTKDELEAAGGGNFQSRDELYDSAVDIVVRERRGSVSLLQRALGIGYGRAARLIDFMAEDGIVGQYNGAQARDVLISLEEWEVRNQHVAASGEAASDFGELSRAAAGTRGITIAPHSVTRTSAGVEDDSARERRPAAIATGHPPRRNKITPAADEVEDEYEDESVAEAVDDEEWEDEDEELEDDSEEESFDDEEELDETQSGEDEEFEDEESEGDDAEECDEDDSDEEWEQEPVTKTTAARSRSN
jgi:S-DNA-T family DNA segregation ATPase FtsK/SpoIIIE